MMLRGIQACRETQRSYGVRGVTQVRLFASSHNKNPTNGSPVKYHRPLKTKLKGIEILHDPLWNKSLAFDIHERDRLGLRGKFGPLLTL